MPPVAAAIGAIAGGIGTVGGAVLAAGGSALGGLATAGGSALGGLATAGTAAVSGITGLFSPGYGVAGGLIGPATKPIGYGITEFAGKVLPVVQAGQQVYGMFQKPEGPPTVAAPITTSVSPGAVPANILQTLPNFIRAAPTQQIMTTPPPPPPPENFLAKNATLIAAAVIGYLVLRS